MGDYCTDDMKYRQVGPLIKITHKERNGDTRDRNRDRDVLDDH
jgi:hypothetical protein